jgi:ribosome recycling factor
MAEEEDVSAVMDETRDSMDKALERYRKELTRVRTGRASTSLLDGVTVDYFDTPTPLNQLATLSVPDPRMIVVSPFDKSSIASIEKSIHASDQVRKIAEDHRIRVRDARRDALSLLKDLESDGLSKDDRHRAEKKVQDVTDQYVGKIDELTAQKEKDVLEV